MKGKFRLTITSLILVFSLPSLGQYNTKKLLQEGRQQLEQGFYVSSLLIFQKIAALNGNLYEPWYLMAKAKYHLEDYQGAEEDCVKTLSLQPYIADIYDLYGMVLIKQGKYKQAAEAYSNAIDIDKMNTAFYFNRAYCYYEDGQREKAVAELEKIVRQWPSFKMARSFLQEIKSDKVVTRKFNKQSPLPLPKLPLKEERREAI